MNSIGCFDVVGLQKIMKPFCCSSKCNEVATLRRSNFFHVLQSPCALFPSSPTLLQFPGLVAPPRGSRENIFDDKMVWGMFFGNIFMSGSCWRCYQVNLVQSEWLACAYIRVNMYCIHGCSQQSLCKRNLDNAIRLLTYGYCKLQSEWALTILLHCTTFATYFLQLLLLTA